MTQVSNKGAQALKANIKNIWFSDYKWTPVISLEEIKTKSFILLVLLTFHVKDLG